MPFVNRNANGDIVERFFAPQFAGQEWVEDSVLAFSIAIEAARNAINNWKASQIVSGFDWNGHHWDSDETAKANIMAIALAGLASPLGYWTDAANNDVPVDAAGMQAMYAAMLQRGAEIHARQRAMKLSLETMTLEELQVFVPSWG
jgi:hypothetical protein